MSLGTGTKGKVLLTGCSVKTIADITGTIKNEYQLLTCQLPNGNFTKALKDYKPNTAVICLQDESRDIFKNYGSLITDMDFAEMPIIIVGSDEDCFQFKCKLPVENIETFGQPLNQRQFLNVLGNVTERSKQKMQWAEPEENTYSDTVKPPVDEPGSNERNGRKVILVVDDDVQMLNVIKLYLQDVYDVAAVPSGKLAIKFLGKKSADLVLLDYLMPKMDGPAVLKEIRENSPHPEIPVIFLTGVSDKNYVMKGLEFRPNSYLLKPVSKELLLERVMGILQGV